MPSLVLAVLSGLTLGVAFNPVASVAGAGVAAGLAGHPKATRSREAWAVVVLATAWLLGDGFRVMARLRDTLDGGHLAAAAGTELGVWALVALAVGYVAPMLLGAYVGRNVVRGTGWLSAIAVAAMCSGLLTRLAAPVLAFAHQLTRG